MLVLGNLGYCDGSKYKKGDRTVDKKYEGI